MLVIVDTQISTCSRALIKCFRNIDMEIAAVANLIVVEEFLLFAKLSQFNGSD